MNLEYRSGARQLGGTALVAHGLGHGLTLVQYQPMDLTLQNPAREGRTLNGNIGGVHRPLYEAIGNIQLVN